MHAALANMIGVLRVNEPWWLNHVHFLLQCSMQEFVVDIELPQRSVVRQSNREHGTNRYRFCNRTESVEVILPILLEKTFCHKTGFILCDSAIRVSFNAKNPCAPNGTMRRRRYKFPGGFLDQCVVLIIHCFAP